MSQTPIASYGQEFLVIDMHNLFVSTTLADEILVLGGLNFIEEEIVTICAKFGINVSASRTLTSYSGGEQAIICCVMIMCLLSDQNLSILLVHILETLSEHNRQQLLAEFRITRPLVNLFTLGPGGPQHIAHV